MRAEYIRRAGAWLLVLSLMVGPAAFSARAEDGEAVLPAETAAETIPETAAPAEETAAAEEPSAPAETPAPEETPVLPEPPAAAPEEVPTGAETLPDPYADVETEADWRAGLPELTGKWGADVVAIAESQLGVSVSERNYELDADGVMHPYTRYGAWAGRPYEPWCAMFVSFCLYYAEIPAAALPRAYGCHFWMETLKEAELYIGGEAAESYVPEPGDLVFFAPEPDAVPTHAGIVKECRLEENGGQTLVTIEGNNGPAVRELERTLGDMTDCAVVGYVSLRAAREAWEQRCREENAEHTRAAAKKLRISRLLRGEKESLWLILLPEAPADGCVYTLNGEPFCYSEAHEAWCLPQWAAARPDTHELAELPGRAETLPADGDINETGKTDINDAQYLYAVLNGAADPASCPAKGLVKADLDANGRLDAKDVSLLFTLAATAPETGK